MWGDRVRRLILLSLAVMLVAAGAARAADCPGNPDALGTSRTIVVDATEHPRVGTMQYRETLPLNDHEVVLTFDDGPIPPRSTQVLEILASQCVKATFFLVGQMARAHPDTVRKIEAAGHTIGTHSESHPLTFHKMPEEKAEQEINLGIASVAAVLNDRTRLAPFFRIPGFLRKDSVEKYLASQHLMTWCADFPADDWTKISSNEVAVRALKRIEEDGKGILLLHDIHPRTVEALPVILAELKRRGYRIVHVVPATPDEPKTATDPRQWIMHARSIWPSPIEYADVEPSLPAPTPASFGVSPLFGEAPVFPVSTLRGRPVVARGQVPLPPVSVWPRNLDKPPTGPILSNRVLLPAPSPESFVFTANAPWQEQKATFPVVPDLTGTTILAAVPNTAGMRVAMSRLAMDEKFVEDGSTRRWPITPGLPHGPFP
jgi:peptidoglycan/xylan/chitin deacetylase (PgdA/CDA1 family)